MTAVTKTTTLEGYFATGDNECFCFDKCCSPLEHYDSIKADPRYAKWLANEAEFDPDHCRVYPSELLPEGTGWRRGTWTITVTFTEDENV